MEKNLERKTIFLYPNLAYLEREEVLLTNSLITDVNLVVNSANSLIRRILSSGNFSFINCLPTVQMRSVCESESACIDCNNVRICISGYNEIDYTKNYSQLIEEYHNGSSDISHLVAIHITKKNSKVQFICDDSGKFDVIVKSNIDHLENILVAIMLDISLYHYFLLSNELTFRKKFNQIKYNYVISKSQLDLNNIYGVREINEKPFYLPLSLPYVNKLEHVEKEERRNSFISELINYYANFIVDTISHTIECNNRGSIISNSNSRDLKNYSHIENYIRNYRAKKFFMIVPDDLTENCQISVIEYDDTTDKVSAWIDKNFESIGSYQIIKVVERD